MVKAKKKLPKKISKLIKDRYYGDKPVVKTGKPSPIYQKYYDSGLLTPEEFSKLPLNKLNDYNRRFLVNNSLLGSFYILNGRKSKYYKERPVISILKKHKLERDKIREARNKTWWQPLTDAQKHFIVTNTPKGKPYSYMGKPLSNHNLYSLKFYIRNNTGIMSLLNRRDVLKNFKVVDHIEPMEVLQKQRELLGEQINKILGREKQVIDSLRANFPSSNINVTTGDSKADIQIEFKESKVPLNYKPANTIAREHGLNEFKKRNKLQSNVDIADAFLKQTKSGKIDYYVNSYQNAVALAEAVGMIPQELFKTLCYQIVKRKTHFKKEEFLNTGNAVAELVEMYQTRKKTMERQFDLKLSIRKFYASKQRKDWSKKYNYNWPNHARFNEEFPKWVKIMTSVATPKKSKFPKTMG